MNITRGRIKQYLSEIKASIRNDRYTIVRNENRQDNFDLFVYYIIDEAEAKKILLSLQVDDFSEIRQNDHTGYEYEQLYIFGKDVKLAERYGNEEKIVPLYIKFNKLDNEYVIVISFHEQQYPITYFFK